MRAMAEIGDARSVNFGYGIPGGIPALLQPWENGRAATVLAARADLTDIHPITGRALPRAVWWLIETKE